MVTVIDHPDDMRRWSEADRADGHMVGLVPTMGALHQGHESLIDAARGRTDRVVVSIFVNPLQFGEATDLEHYPRPLADDLDICGRHGVDVVYAPIAATMYPPHFASNVSVAGLADTMEGAARPGHFDGVTTVVAKLFAAVRPHVAVFGEKDYQQLAIVRRMTADLDLGVEIVSVPTVREADGVALSSRNRRLTGTERTAAACIPAAIAAARTLAVSGAADASEIVSAAREVIEREPLARLDYIELFHGDTLHAVHTIGTDQRLPGLVRIAMAVRFGEVRLIDNADLFDDHIRVKH